jgi:hypothetical protein
MSQLKTLPQQNSVFCLPTSSIKTHISNQWTVYREHGSYEVYLETTKDDKTTSQHAGSFSALSEAIIFSIHINRSCTGRRPLQKA